MSNSTRPSSSSYDERFVVPLEASRRGAHRARQSAVMAVLPVAAVVGIVVGAISLVYLFMGGLGGDDQTGQATAAVSSSAPPLAEEPTAEASDTPTSTAAIDKTTPVAVYNGTSPLVSGLARKAGVKLTDAGWTLGAVETWTGAAVTQTTVYYATEDLKPTALAVVKALGKGTAKLSAAKAGTGITVVVGNDYPGAGGTKPTTPARTTSTRSTAPPSAEPSSPEPTNSPTTPVG